MKGTAAPSLTLVPARGTEKGRLGSTSSGVHTSGMKAPCARCLANAPRRAERVRTGLRLCCDSYSGKTLLETGEVMKLEDKDVFRQVSLHEGPRMGLQERPLMNKL